jgi:chaperonin cofactor prefoldin
MSKKFYGEQQKKHSNGYTSLEDLLEMARNGSESNRELIIKLTERMGEFRNKHNELVRLTQTIGDKHNALGHFIEKDHDDLGTLYNIKDSMVNRIDGLALRIEKLEQSPAADTSRLDKLERAVKKNRRKTGKQALAICGVCGLLYVGYKALDTLRKEVRDRAETYDRKLQGLREDVSDIARAQYCAGECGETEGSRKEPDQVKVTIDSMTESDG